MKLLVYQLYLAKAKASGPAFKRILSCIDFHNQLYEFKSRFFFENFYGQKRLTRMIPMPINFKIHFLWLTNLIMISCRFLHFHKVIPLWKYDFFPILDSAYAILVLCSRQVLVMSKDHPRKQFSHRKAMTPKKWMSISKSLTNTKHMGLEPLFSLTGSSKTALRILVVFFNCNWCRIFILGEIHCQLCPHIFGE